MPPFAFLDALDEATLQSLGGKGDVAIYEFACVAIMGNCIDKRR